MKVNYTDDMIATLREGYDPKDSENSVKELAEKVDRTVPSVRQKLVELNLYVAKEKASKKGRVTKEMLVKAVGVELGIAVPSLENATVTDIEVLMEALEVDVPVAQAA